MTQEISANHEHELSPYQSNFEQLSTDTVAYSYQLQCEGEDTTEFSNEDLDLVSSSSSSSVASLDVVDEDVKYRFPATTRQPLLIAQPLPTSDLLAALAPSDLSSGDTRNSETHSDEKVHVQVNSKGAPGVMEGKEAQAPIAAGGRILRPRPDLRRQASCPPPQPPLLEEEEDEDEEEQLEQPHQSDSDYEPEGPENYSDKDASAENAALPTELSAQEGDLSLKPNQSAKSTSKKSSKRTLGPNGKRIYTKRKPPQPTTCEICPKSFRCPSELRKHHKQKHSIVRADPIPCPTCNKLFAHRVSLRAHLRTVHADSKPFHCPTCDLSFTTLAYLRGHTSRVHDPLRKRNFICAICGYPGSSNKFHLSQHMLSHTGTKPVLCSLCGVSLRSELLLGIHMKRSHEQTTRFKCEHPGCNKVFGSRQNLIRHSTSHSESRPFVCHVPGCGSSFKLKLDLGYHQRRSHFNKSKPVCTTCGQKFMLPQNLKKHEFVVHGLISSKSVVHACSHCERTYPNDSSLRQHVKFNHSEERSFVCEECGSKFKSKSNLQQHQVTHLAPEERKFKCGECGKRFGLASTLRVHEVNVHKGAADKKKKKKTDDATTEN